MEIDIIHSTRSATALERLIMETYNQKVRYVVLDKNGEEYTVQFDVKSLKEFCPKKTVSEMLTIWEDGIKRQIQLYEDSLKTKEHPYHTQIQYYYVVESGRVIERLMEIPKQNMRKDSQQYFQKELERLKHKDGKMSFVLISLQ